MTLKPDWDAASLLQLSGGYWQIFTLHAAVRLDVFSAIGDKAVSSESLARRLSCDLRAMAMLLNALSAMGLLRKEQEQFRLVEASARFLVQSSDRYIGHMISHHHHLAPSWAFLHEAIQSGGPLRKRVSAEAEQRREAFLMGMFNIASMQAPQVVGRIDLSGRRRLLDLGGGPATYAIHFCLANPDLRAVVFDLATTRPFAEKTIARYGLSDRIRFAAGDFQQDEIKGSYDAVWLSHILHAEGFDDCRRIVTRAAAVLESGGVMIIHEFILEESMDAPLYPALFALNMLLGTPHGQSYSESQLREMMQQAGITKIRRENFTGPMQSGIISGVKV
jgi:predicted O-methyltransferase YrrM